MNHSKESAKAKAKAHKEGKSGKSKDGKMPAELLQSISRAKQRKAKSPNS